MKTLLFLLIFSFSAFAETHVTLFVELTPAGSFQAVTSRPKGTIVHSGDSLTSDKISISIESLKTGIDLRDEHTWKHFNSSKYPKATLMNVQGKGGRASATLEVNGIQKPVNISYAIKGNEVTAQFKVKASDFKLPKAEYLGVGVQDEVLVKAQMPIN